MGVMKRRNEVAMIERKGMRKQTEAWPGKEWMLSGYDWERWGGKGGGGAWGGAIEREAD